MLPLRLLISRPDLPDVSMQRDSQLLHSFSSDHSQPQGPILHFYAWSVPSLTYGYFAKPDQLLHRDKLAQHGLHMARRPTGGGVIFHLSDFAFSLLLPRNHPKVQLNPDSNYACVHAVVREALSTFLPCSLYGRDFSLMQELPQRDEDLGANRLRPTFCMAEVSRYDLIVDGKKVGGAAQRQTRDGLLHQCSLYLTSPPFEILQEVMQQGEEVVERMKEESMPLIDSFLSEEELDRVRQQLRTCLYEAMRQAF